MDKKEHDKIIAFDTLFTTNHIQILKIVMTYCDYQLQKKLAVYIKYLELQYTLSYYTSHPSDLYGCSFTEKEFNISKLCSEILPFCTNDQKQKIEQIAGIFRTMEMYKEMSQTFEMMKDVFPEGFGDSFPFGMSPDGTPDTPDGSVNQNNNMVDMLMGMLSPEQQTMFEMFGGNNNESK